MSEEVDNSLIKEVQSIFSKQLKKPPLTEKLLKKPPFRYLHDLITSIIQETGFLNGLYTAEELDSNNVKDKDSKIAFLDKLINAVKTSTGKNIIARPGKIVAGLEVNKTLELLIVIGKAINEKPDTTKAAAQQSSKNGEKTGQKTSSKPVAGSKSKKPVSNESVPKEPPKVSKTEATTSKKTEPAKETPKKKNATESRRDSSVDKKKSNETKEAKTAKSITRKSSIQEKWNAAEKKAPMQSKPIIKKSVKEDNQKTSPAARKRNSISPKKIPESIEEAEDKNKAPEKADANENVVESVNMKKEENHDTQAYSADTGPAVQVPAKIDKPEIIRRDSTLVQRPGSARPSSRRMMRSDSQSAEAVGEASSKEPPQKKPEDPRPPSAKPRTARPPSARPGAPRIRDRGEVSVADETMTIPNAVNVIEEGKQDPFPDDKDNFIVIESESAPTLQTDESAEMNDQEQGQLVHQILKTQKELNESVAVDSQNKHLEIEWEAGRQRERDLVTKEVDKIRGILQALTSAANPLGKLFDFLQEDVDEMQRELQHWKTANESLHKQQLSELELGKNFLQPLRKQLADIEANIQEEYAQISNIKTTILLNDEKILRLVNGNKVRTK